MSHNVSIDHVKIANMSVLQTAIAELSKAGVGISLDQCGTFRTYRGQPNKSDYTIHLPKETYDVGLNKQSDGSYKPVYDADLVANKSVACEYTPGTSYKDRERGALGKLLQTYSVCLMEHEAVMAGHSTRRETKENGDIDVLVEVAA